MAIYRFVSVVGCKFSRGATNSTFPGKCRSLHYSRNSQSGVCEWSYAPELSDVSGLPKGIYVGNLTELPEAFCKYFRPYLGQQPGSEEVFTGLNTASIADVAIVWAAPNVVVETPIHLLFLSVAGESPSFSQPRGWIVAEKNCSLKIIEQYVGEGFILPME